MTPRRRGSAMILMIAVLALLAVLATVYLASSHIQRASALAADESMNLDLARDAALALVREQLYDDTLGGYSGSLFYVPRPWMPSDPGGKGPKTYYPLEPVELQISTGSDRLAFFENQIVLGPDFKLYGCTSFHQADFANHGPPPGNTRDWAPLTTLARQAVGNVSSRWYDYPERPLVNNWQNFGTSVDGAGNFVGTPDQPLLNRDLLYGPANNTDLSFLTGARFDPHTGDNDLPYTMQGSPGSGDTSVASFMDASWHMLPFSSPAGTRYRFALRVIDTNRMANINTGFVSSLGHVIDPDGVSISSVQLDNPEIFDGDTPDHLHNTRLGYIDKSESHTPIEWQTRSSAFALAGFNPGIRSPLIPDKLNRPFTTLFDLAEELELRAHAGHGTGYVGRAQLAWPTTLQPITDSHVNRNYYTTYSFDRQVTTAFSPRFILLDWLPIVIPVPPPCYNTFMSFASYNGSTPLSLHDPRTNFGGYSFIELLDLLVHNGYSDDEAISFALNAVYQASGNPNISVVRDGRNFFYRDPNGRLYLFWTPRVDIPWRHCPSGGADPPCDVYLPFVAQPFLNELAVILQPPASQQESPSALDFAVELLNPYTSAPLNIRGWRLRVGNDPWFTFGDSGSPVEVPAAADADAPGFLTVNLSREGGGFRGFSSKIVTVPSTAIDPVGQPVFLERPYLDNRGRTKWMVVDHFDWPSPPPVMMPGAPPETLSFQRNNVTSTPTQTQPKPGAVDGWLASCPVAVKTFSEPSLNRANDVVDPDPELYGVYLPDRFADTFQSGASPYPSPFVNRNVGQLEYISRIGPRLTRNGTPVTVPDLLADRSTLFTAGGRSYFPQEAKVRFDFLADPRAIEFLRYLTTSTNSSNSRIPGRVNVNTATPEVLVAVLSNITRDTALAHNFAAAIVAYRDRMRRTDILDDHFSRGSPNYDFRSAALYPGRGIRSIAELAIPLGIVTGTLEVDGTVSPPQIRPVKGQTLLTLHGTPNVRYLNPYDLASPSVAFFVPPPNIPVYASPSGVPRDHPGGLWPRLFTQLSVRSDSFFVYGYMEGLRIHPNVSLDRNLKNYHDNGFSWYDFDSGGNSMPQIDATVDNPDATPDQDPALRNLRVVRRRFMALIDRSYSVEGRTDYSSTIPPIIAIKDMPTD